MTPEEISRFHQDGFFIARKVFDSEEVALLSEAMEKDPAVQEHILIRADGEGGGTRIALWNRAGSSVYGLAARCERMVDTAEQLLGGPVYHYQSKLTAKEAHTGGAWEWHQDYGYWYYNGCLFPHLVSCMIALDRTDRENGCLQFLKGSHLMGRADHVKLTDEQNEIDPKIVSAAQERLQTVYAEADPGDVVFFHCNMFHRSDQNRSEKRRWTLIICYNRVDNDTYTREDDRFFVPLEKVRDQEIKIAGLKFADGRNEEHFATKPYVPDISAADART
jgi:ectoine hydroxylase-related dioxygenase (phytanoyl-CoA dioxygenase family)